MMDETLHRDGRKRPFETDDAYDARCGRDDKMHDRPIINPRGFYKDCPSSLSITFAFINKFSPMTR